jgi:hypothetical protein
MLALGPEVLGRPDSDHAPVPQKSGPFQGVHFAVAQPRAGGQEKDFAGFRVIIAEFFKRGLGEFLDVKA